MINELYQLSAAMKQAGVSPPNWHRKYKPLPNATDKAPCIKLTIHENRIAQIDSIPKEQAALLRKYGSNQGTFPCMNLAPLFRIADKDIKKTLSVILPEQIDSHMLSCIRSWCVEDNWNTKFRKKYAQCMKAVPEELFRLLQGYEYKPATALLEDASPFADPDLLHTEMQRTAFEMLKRRENIKLALSVLFHAVSVEKAADNDIGTLSVALESSRLIDMGTPAVSSRFVRGFNQVLLSADTGEEEIDTAYIKDAFGNAFAPVERPMPSVKLAGGFEATLRTMFKEQRCQHRYGAIENASYPIAPRLRMELQSALAWLGSSEHKEIYWLNTHKDEILFAYPHTLPPRSISFVNPFKCRGETLFETAADEFLECVTEMRLEGAERFADYIQLFILKKISRGQTKVVYSRATSSHELKDRCAEWIAGCRGNLPKFPFRQPKIPFPLDAAEILNLAWTQGGAIATERFKPVPASRGMELLLDKDTPLTRDMHILVESCTKIAPYIGSNRSKDLSSIMWKVKRQIAMLGLMLYRKNIKKEQYMNGFAYQYGQLLKAADELHILYCLVVRGGDMPSQLIGSGMYQAAVEMPVRTLALLSQRMTPYMAWAKTYRTENVRQEGRESWRAGWLLSVLGKTAGQLSKEWSYEKRLTDEEKAEMFLGYLAALPKAAPDGAKDTNNESTNDANKEEMIHE